MNQQLHGEHHSHIHSICFVFSCRQAVVHSHSVWCNRFIFYEESLSLPANLALLKSFSRSHFLFFVFMFIIYFFRVPHSEPSCRGKKNEDQRKSSPACDDDNNTLARPT